MRLKRKSQIGIALVATIIAISAGTVAYFATSEKTHNVISTGGVKVALYELSDPSGSGSTEDLVPFKDIENIIPGELYSKIPFVKNEDTEPAWIRAHLSLTKTSPDGTVTPVPDLSSIIELIDLSSNWTYLNDYYYYTPALAATELTDPLFKGIKFKENIDVAAGTVYALSIFADATQTANNGDSALTATGWPED